MLVTKYVANTIFAQKNSDIFNIPVKLSHHNKFIGEALKMSATTSNNGVVLLEIQKDGTLKTLT